MGVIIHLGKHCKWHEASKCFILSNVNMDSIPCIWRQQPTICFLPLWDPAVALQPHCWQTKPLAGGSTAEKHLVMVTGLMVVSLYVHSTAASLGFVVPAGMSAGLAPAVLQVSSAAGSQQQPKITSTMLHVTQIAGTNISQKCAALIFRVHPKRS